jgi:hypothetical protein
VSSLRVASTNGTLRAANQPRKTRFLTEGFVRGHPARQHPGVVRPGRHFDTELRLDREPDLNASPMTSSAMISLDGVPIHKETTIGQRRGGCAAPTQDQPRRLLVAGCS